MVSEVEPMATNSLRTAWIWVAVAGLLLTGSLLVVQWSARWREVQVYQALRESQSPAFWWPPDWRRELRTSFLLEGNVYLWDAELRRAAEEHTAPPNRSALGHPVKAGTMELVSETEGRVFRTAVNPNGWYSFNRQRLPTAPFKVRLVSPEGSASRWLPMGALDPGLHRINWSF
jgi:hypothetical protein